MNPYKDDAAVLTAVLAVARMVVSRLEDLMFFQPFAAFSPFVLSTRLLVALRGAICAGSSLAIARGMPREEVARELEAYAQRLRRGESPGSLELLSVWSPSEGGGKAREPPS